MAIGVYGHPPQPLTQQEQLPHKRRRRRLHRHLLPPLDRQPLGVRRRLPPPLLMVETHRGGLALGESRCCRRPQRRLHQIKGHPTRSHTGKDKRLETHTILKFLAVSVAYL